MQRKGETSIFTFHGHIFHLRFLAGWLKWIWRIIFGCNMTITSLCSFPSLPNSSVQSSFLTDNASKRLAFPVWERTTCSCSYLLRKPSNFQDKHKSKTKSKSKAKTKTKAKSKTNNSAYILWYSVHIVLVAMQLCLVSTSEEAMLSSDLLHWATHSIMSYAKAA